MITVSTEITSNKQFNNDRQANIEFTQDIDSLQKLLKFKIQVNLPQLFLAYSPNPSDSGRIHSNVKQRWLAGDTEIIEGMKYFGQIVDKAKTALESENWDELKELMNANFEQRRKLYTGKNYA